MLVSLTACGQSGQEDWMNGGAQSYAPQEVSDNMTGGIKKADDNNGNTSGTDATIPDDFVKIEGGTYTMGSPESESWRGSDETQHQVTVSSFYMSRYELTQEEYEQITGNNPSNFKGAKLPVESVTWLDAVNYCNLRSEKEGRTPVYTVDGNSVSWNRSANGYRLPTEAEWEYACRAGTTTPFNTENSISADEADYYGHYPYMIEDNYFSQENLDTKPGLYRQTTVDVGSFSPNKFGLYDMHGNVGEWVWDYYGDYSTEAVTDPTGPEDGTLRVYRGGGWNDFAKNMRSAYRATLAQDMSAFNVGIRLVLNDASLGNNSDAVNSKQSGSAGSGSGSSRVLIAYFSWSGNTRGIAQEIQNQTGADLFEISPKTPYSSDYNTVLAQAQKDQRTQARPELTYHIENMDQYDTIILGYPNWWASIPMPIATFLEEYDFSGKTIIPFCSHGGGRFGQSLTAITKLAPAAKMGEALSIHYSGGDSMPSDVSDWLKKNGISKTSASAPVQRRISLDVDGTKLTATLYDTPTANALYERLPLDLTFEDFNGIEKISYLTDKLPTQGEPDGCDPDVGDLCLYAPWGNLSIFYNDFRYSESLIMLGHIDGGMDVISGKTGNFHVRIEAVK